MAGGQLRRGRRGRGGLGQRPAVLPAARPAGLGSSCVGVWARVDGAVHPDGDCRVAGLAGARVQRGADGAAALCRSVGLNAVWTWLFFAWHRGALAAVEIVVLWLLILATGLAFGRIRTLAALLLLPYFLWVTYAGALTIAVWRANPGLL